MPRSVRVAIGCVAALTVLGLASLALKITGSRSLLGDVPFAVLAGAYLPGLARQRDARTRELAFLLALGSSIVLGVLETALLVLAIMRGPVAPLAAGSVAWALLVALAWALSRPSAKAWFNVGRAA